MTENVWHTLIVLALVAAYVTVTLSGADASGILGALGGYLGGAGVARVTRGADGGGVG